MGLNSSLSVQLQPGTEDINFSCSTQMSIFDLVINFKMPTIVGILKFITQTNDNACHSELENYLCLYLIFMEMIKFHALVS